MSRNEYDGRAVLEVTAPFKSTRVGHRDTKVEADMVPQLQCTANGPVHERSQTRTKGTTAVSMNLAAPTTGKGCTLRMCSGES